MQYVARDDFMPTGRYLDHLGLVSGDRVAQIRREGAVWEAELAYLWHSHGERNFSFGLSDVFPAIPLLPGRENHLELVLQDPTAVETRWSLAETEVLLHPDTLIVPVAVWNLGVATLNEPVARLIFDRAGSTRFPTWVGSRSWARQRVDAVWQACHIQFRLVAYRDLWLEAPCWHRPVVSNQATFNQKCVTGRPACTPDRPETQDFLDCAQQEENRCTLLELVRWTLQSPGAGRPAVFEPEAINVYFAEGFHLWEDLTAGIGCRGDQPLVALSDVWSDFAGLRLAHELGHAMGISKHLSQTVMADARERTAVVTEEICAETRATLLELYPWIE